MKKITILTTILLLCTIANAQEVIVGYGDDSLPILNEELRRSRDRLQDLENAPEDLSDVIGVLDMENGGTGESLVDPGVDRILFWDDSETAVSWLIAGTNISIEGEYLDVEVEEPYDEDLIILWQARPQLPENDLDAVENKGIYPFQIDMNGTTLTSAKSKFNTYAFQQVAVSDGEYPRANLEGLYDSASEPLYALREGIMGSGDWTVDGWWYIKTNASDHRTLWTIGKTYNTDFVSLGMHNNGSMTFEAEVGNVDKANYYSSASVVQFDTWAYYRLVRSGTNLWLFIDGVNIPLTASTPIGSNSLYFSDAGSEITLLYGWQTNYLRELPGYADDFRIYNGALNTSTDTFLAPTKAAIPNSSLLSAATPSGSIVLAPVDEPPNPVKGQVWCDGMNGLRVWYNSAWR